MPPEIQMENLAQTLARELPIAKVAHTQSTAVEANAITHLVVPKSFSHIAIDNEALLEHPRRAKASATLTEPESFLAYIERHKTANTVVWAAFNPSTFQLNFKAVIDEHGPLLAGWRGHTAAFTPVLANEWNTWIGSNGEKAKMDQATFAAFIENQEEDFASIPGFPSHLEMLKMATDFEARQDQGIKSSVRLQSGGVELSYISNDDAQTVEKMKLFEKFKVGIPVFRGMKDEMGQPLGYIMEARLRYRVSQNKATFWYELVRPDKTHELAAKQLLVTVKDGLGDVPMLMGSCN